MDIEMIKRCAEVLRKHHIMTEPTAAIIVLEFIKAMREPTQSMMNAGSFIDTAQSGVYNANDVYTAMIDSIVND